MIRLILWLFQNKIVQNENIEFVAHVQTKEELEVRISWIWHNLSYRKSF